MLFVCASLSLVRSLSAKGADQRWAGGEERGMVEAESGAGGESCMASQFADKDAEEDDKETLQESCTSPLDDLANLPASLFQVEEPAVNPTSGEQATQVVE